MERVDEFMVAVDAMCTDKIKIMGYERGFAVGAEKQHTDRSEST